MVSHSTIKEISSKQIKAEPPLIATSLQLPLSSVPIVTVMETFNYKLVHVLLKANKSGSRNDCIQMPNMSLLLLLLSKRVRM